MNRVVVMIILLSTMLLLGCAQSIKCTEPNVVIDNKCCLDADNDGFCDYDQVQVEETTKPTIDKTYDKAETEYQQPQTQPETKPEPEIVRYTSKPADKQVDFVPNYQEGVSDIRAGEPHQWVQIHDLSAYRSSRDTGQMEWMYYTVRNLGSKPMKLGVDLFFQYGRTSTGLKSPVGKEYTLDELKPGQKVTINQSLGFYFDGIEETKTITLDVYDRLNYPKESLQQIKKTFKPSDYMDTMEIMQYGRDD